jgi:Flp pilus assembly protein TadD
MKHLQKLIFTLCIGCFIHFTVIAQNNNQATDLVKQGELLHSQGKYEESIAKFSEALKIEPDNAAANYGLAFTLYSAKRATEGIPYLEKVVKSSHPGLVVGAYSLMGTIYDDSNQPQKAIEAFNQAIKLAPDYPGIYYSLGLAYSRNQQYAEAEASAIEAIKHEPKNASCQRLYALACFHQNKRVNALLGFCSFILLEPATSRTAEAYGNIQHILQGGVLKDNNGNVSKESPEITQTNIGITNAVAEAKKKKLTGMDLLQNELTGIFTFAGKFSEKKTDQTFFDKYLADYFYKLAQSDNMPAFTRTISLSANTDENSKWLKDNPQKVAALNEWIGKTERGF